MVILHLISSSNFHGAEQVVVEVAKNKTFVDNSISILLLSNDVTVYKLFTAKLAVSSVELHFIDSSKMNFFTTLVGVIQVLKKGRFDIVHSHGYKSDIITFCLKIASFGKDLTIIATNHNWIGTSSKELLYEKLDKFILKFFDKVISVSDELRMKMIQAGIPQKKIVTIKNGIDVNDPSFYARTPAELRKEVGLDTEVFVIGCVARLTREKNHKRLLRAFSEFLKGGNEGKLVLIGDGPEHGALVQLAAQLGIGSKIHFLGHQKEARKLYRLFDVFCLVSENEGLPMALLEAMAARVPVVVSNVGEMPDVVGKVSSEVIVQPHNVEGMAQAIESLYLNQKMRNELAEKGRDVVEIYYSSEAMAHKYLNLYQSTCERIG